MMVEPDDYDDGVAERLLEVGWISEDVVERIRTLLKEMTFETRPGNRSDAALIMIDYEINPPAQRVGDDPHVTWAKTLLKDIL